MLYVVGWCLHFFFFQAEDGIRDLVRSRGLGDVYKRQGRIIGLSGLVAIATGGFMAIGLFLFAPWLAANTICLL